MPLGVTFSFLIAAPMVNEVALGLLFAMLGWKVALTYLGFGLGVAIIAGWVIGRLHLEGWREDWVRNVRAGAVDLPTDRMTIVERIKAGIEATSPSILQSTPDGSITLATTPQSSVCGALGLLTRYRDGRSSDTM